MSARGPAPKPTALKLIEGNRGHRPLNAAEPKPRQVAPRCPTHLDDLAKREWKRLVPVLTHMRVLTEADAVALGLLCQTYADLIRAQEQAHKAGPIMVVKDDKTGKVKYAQVSPLFTITTRYTEMLTKLLAQFGLTPASRVRLVADQEQALDSGLSLIR